jgi:hypothetical protein
MARAEKITIAMACLILTVCIVGAILVIHHRPNARLDNDWRNLTTPLSQHVQQDLCQKLNLSAGDPLCDTGKVRYAPDFFEATNEHFSGNSYTFQDVQSVLGDYLVYLEEPEELADGGQYFLAWYDFHGDGMTAIVFNFSGNHQANKLKNVSPFYWEPGSFKAGEE